MSNRIGRTAPSQRGRQCQQRARKVVCGLARFADRVQPHAVREPTRDPAGSRQGTLQREEDEWRHGQGQRAGPADRHERQEPQHDGVREELAQDAAEHAEASAQRTARRCVGEIRDRTSPPLGLSRPEDGRIGRRGSNREGLRPGDTAPSVGVPVAEPTAVGPARLARMLAQKARADDRRVRFPRHEAGITCVHAHSRRDEGRAHRGRSDRG